MIRAALTIRCKRYVLPLPAHKNCQVLSRNEIFHDPRLLGVEVLHELCKPFFWIHYPMHLNLVPVRYELQLLVGAETRTGGVESQ